MKYNEILEGEEMMEALEELYEYIEYHQVAGTKVFVASEETVIDGEMLDLNNYKAFEMDSGRRVLRTKEEFSLLSHQIPVDEQGKGTGLGDLFGTPDVYLDWLKVYRGVDDDE